MKSNKNKSYNTLQKLAEKYRREGYNVHFYPTGDELPNFLSNFHPDLIATSDNDNVVVEVKTRPNVTGSKEIVRLAELIESKPKWRYELILTRPSKAERVDQILTRPTLDIKQIEERLKTVKQLIESGQIDLAILIAWTVAEAAFRRLAVLHLVPLEDVKSSYLIKMMYSNGIVGWRDYELLQKTFALRNHAAHGFVIDKVDKKATTRFLKLIEKLVEQLKQV